MTRTPAPVFRCFGTGDPLMERYHDEEWGRPVRDEAALFERLVLEAAQSGLSWSTVLHKRETYGAAFLNWDVRRIAAFGEADVARLLRDPGIIRNRKKVESTITNARALVALWNEGESLAELVWAHAPDNPRPQVLHSWADVPTETLESKALAKALKAKGFVFVGPVTMFALMQACGLVDCHFEGCAGVRKQGRR